MVWQSGESGNVKGRPKGTRDTLTKDFISDLSNAWKKDGAKVLAKLVKTDPATFAKLAAQLIPKEHKVSHDINAVADLIKLVTQRQQEALEARTQQERVIEHVNGTEPDNTLALPEVEVINS